VYSITVQSVSVYSITVQFVCTVLQNCKCVQYYRMFTHVEQYDTNLTLTRNIMGYFCVVIKVRFSFYVCRNWCISVSIVFDYRLDDRGSIPGRGKGFFL
jgi:hypothetical protein